MNRAKLPAGKPASKDQRPGQDSAAGPSGRAMRETVESIAVAVILAFLFRQFVAEAFVIPTGSMAPTLQGRHMDVWLRPKCNYQYRTGASVENEGGGEVVATTCPLCQLHAGPGQAAESQPAVVQRRPHPGQQVQLRIRRPAAVGCDRLQVPRQRQAELHQAAGGSAQRDPADPLRRRVLPPHSRRAGRTGSSIARKPPLQAGVHAAIGGRHGLSPGPIGQGRLAAALAGLALPDAPSWEARRGQPGFETAARAGEAAWLRYRHVVPWPADWVDIARGRNPERLSGGHVQGQLITDYYAYNDGVEFVHDPLESARMRPQGLHWVGDLAVECDLEITGSQGELLLELVEGGVPYQCRIDVASGRATL